MGNLTDEFQAAVHLGYLTKEEAEREQSRWSVRGIDREDQLQRKAFRAGFLWAFWRHGWGMTDEDLAAASDAWNLWCDHQEGKGSNPP